MGGLMKCPKYAGGGIKQESQQTGLRPRNEEDASYCEMICDYELKDI